MKTYIFNLQCWALTAETQHRMQTAVKWLFKLSGSTGDFEFIFLELNFLNF